MLWKKWGLCPAPRSAFNGRFVKFGPFPAVAVAGRGSGGPWVRCGERPRSICSGVNFTMGGNPLSETYRPNNLPGVAVHVLVKYPCMLQEVTTTDEGLQVYRSRRRWLLTGIGVVIVAASVAAASWLRPETPRPGGFVAEFGGPGQPLISMHEKDLPKTKVI
jgi:hypothetical protein